MNLLINKMPANRGIAPIKIVSCRIEQGGSFDTGRQPFYPGQMNRGAAHDGPRQLPPLHECLRFSQVAEGVIQMVLHDDAGLFDPGLEQISFHEGRPVKVPRRPYPFGPDDDEGSPILVEAERPLNNG